MIIIFTIYSEGLSANNEAQRIGAQFLIMGNSSDTLVNSVLSDQNSELLVYPNPVSNYLTLASIDNIVSIEVRNIYGGLMNLEEIQDNNITVIDCSGIPSGIYLLNLKDNSGFSHTIKFIKK